VFHCKAFVVNWDKSRGKKALEHITYGRVLWLDVMTHEGERISTINIHQATGGRPDLQRRVNTHSMQKCKSRKGGGESWGKDLNAAMSRTGYPISTNLMLEKQIISFKSLLKEQEDH